MIDIHSHILHGLDDGASDLDVSLEMLRMAAAAGTTDIVATPHANPDHEFSPEVVQQRIAELSVASQGIVNIHHGCDFHLAYENIQDALAHPAKYTINGHNYMLVEFSELVIFNSTGEIFDRLLQAGMVPIVTHPERNWLLQQKIGQLRSWIEKGCLMQVTAASFLGRFGSKARNFALELMKRDMVHFIASDAHDAQDRTTKLDEAFRFVSDKFGPDRAEQLFVLNPRATLTGAPLPTIESAGSELHERKWYQFWR